MRTFVRLSLLAVPLCMPAIGIAEEWLDLRIGNAQVQAEYAVSASQRHRGLMERTELATDQGILFRFDEVRRHCLWMKNTPLPLSAAFIDEQGKIVDLIDLEPLSTAIRCSHEPARYALEMNRGWFGKHEIEIGDSLDGLPD